jgi:hypothetical protein
VDIDLAALPSDVDTLHQLVRELAAQVADDRSELAQAQAEIERLKLIIRRFQRAQLPPKSAGSCAIPNHGRLSHSPAAALQIFFGGARLDQYREKVQSLQANNRLYAVRS